MIKPRDNLAVTKTKQGHTLMITTNFIAKLCRLATIVVATLAVSGLAISAENSHIERKYYNPWEREIGYAPVVKVGNTLYLSGVTSPGETMAEQVESIYTSIGKMLAEHGAGFDDIVKETVFIRDIEALKGASGVRKKFFADGKDPASSWIQIDRLFVEDRMIEVEAIAVLPDK